MKSIAIAVVAIAISANAHAATAHWTGQMRQVQTVTYQMAWNCEYQYLGQKFWRVFTGSCPSSIEVQ